MSNRPSGSLWWRDRGGRGLIAGAAAIALFAGGCSRSQNGGSAGEKSPPAPAVQTANVVRGTLEQALPVSGMLAALPSREAILSPQVGAALVLLPVRFGEHIQRGQLVAQLSTDQLTGQIQQDEATLGQNQVQVQQAEANAIQQQAQTRTSILQAAAGVRNAQAALAGAQATLTGDIATLNGARQSLAREQALFKDGLVAQREVDAAQLAVETADAQVAAQRQAVAGQAETVDGQRQALNGAKAASLQDAVKKKDIEIARQQVKNAQGALTTARSQRALYALHAPLTGTVTALGASVGEAVDTSTKLMTISDLSVLQLQIALPSRDAGVIRSGESVSFASDALPGRSFSTRVESISPQVDTATGTLPVFALVANPAPYLLRDDMTVSARIVTARRVNVLTVPLSALLRDPDTGGKTVGVVGPDHVLHLTPVTVGLVSGGLVEVRSGLREGERVVVAGDYGLSDGTLVAVAAGESPGAGNGS